MTRTSDPGDCEQQFRALYDGNFSAVLGYALRRVDQPSDAADVVSEVFLVAWRRFAEAPPGDGRPWLFGIARNVLANHHRGNRRRRRLGARLRDTVAREVAPDPATSVAEWDRVRSTLQRLHPVDRELLMLVGWDGLTPMEAAVVLGISPGATRMRLKRARQRFRALFAWSGDARAASGHDQAVPFEHATGEPR